ncbi:uncharacterized protein TNCV_10441 [Trichonephila clavipes]|nr:uncharacterized protein TNCV_10441 [Trichonephila clavipes]
MQENIIERHCFGGARLLDWKGFILGFRTDLHVQIGTMSGEIYRNGILEQHVRLFQGAIDAEFAFMDDNARPHWANIVSECLQSEDITPMDWPASTGLQSSRTCVVHAWLISCSPSTTSYMSTETLESIA